MTDFLIYFLKVNLGIAFLYSTYYLLLRKEKFFVLNRIILLSIILLAFLLPLLPSLHVSKKAPLGHGVFGLDPFSGLVPFDLPADHYKNAGHGETAIHTAIGMPFVSFTFTEVLHWIYLLCTGTLLFRLLLQLRRLSMLIIHSRRERKEGIVYCYHDQPLPPFSFFRFLVLNEQTFEPSQLQQIITHEKVHIKEGHSLHLLLIEFLHALLWINPFIYGLKRTIRLNLEYIADDKVLKTGVDSRSYQYNILSCMRLKPLPLTNLLTSSKIKLRINMMNTKKTPRRNLYKYALVLPLLAGTYLAVNPLKARSAPAFGPTENPLPALEELKAFEGYYQMGGDGGPYIKITASGRQLILKQLWDNEEIRFDQQSELDFSAMKGKFPLKFSKNSEGTVVSVLAFNKDLWNKVKEYKPVATITLAPEKLKPFEGFYKLNSEKKQVYIQILTDEGALILRQGWDGQEIPFQPTSENSFYAKGNAFPLDFTKDANGNVTEMLAFKRDVWKRMANPSEAIIKKAILLDEGNLKAFEGKYHMKTEKGEDAYISIRQSGHNLILKQSWDNKEVRLTPYASSSFFSKDRGFDIVFTLDSNGAAVSALAFGKDHWEKVKE